MSPAAMVLFALIAIMVVGCVIVDMDLVLRYRLWRQSKKYVLPTIPGYYNVRSVFPIKEGLAISYQNGGVERVSSEDVIVLLHHKPYRHIVDAISLSHKGFYDRGVYYDQGKRKLGCVSVFVAGSDNQARIQFCKDQIKDHFIGNIAQSRKHTVESLSLDLPYVLRQADIKAAVEELVKDGVLEGDDFGYYDLTALFKDFINGKSKYGCNYRRRRF